MGEVEWRWKSMKLNIANSFDGNETFIAKGDELVDALENALNQLGWQSYIILEDYEEQ